MTTTSGKPGISVGDELTTPEQLSQGNSLTWLGSPSYPDTSSLLLQSGDYLLLQPGGNILLQAA
jgi:hypothetical protein